MDFIIREINFKSEKLQLLEVIRTAFITVAKEFNLTENNAPTNPAFLSMDRLEEAVKQGVEFYVLTEENHIAGCVGIQPGREDGEYYIERLAVLPEARHQGVGRKLLKHAIELIRGKGSSRISIGIIDENIVLKQWYLKQSFRELGNKKFEHLPFTVCFMVMDLS